MSDIPENYFFTKEHEWVCQEGDVCRVGISQYAADELGDVVFVDLPSVGQSCEKGQSMFTVESVKAVSDIYSPVNAEVSGVNDALESEPELVNSAPFTDGWMVEVSGDSISFDDLMNAEQYQEYVATVAK